MRIRLVGGRILPISNSGTLGFPQTLASDFLSALNGTVDEGDDTSIYEVSRKYGR